MKEPQQEHKKLCAAKFKSDWTLFMVNVSYCFFPQGKVFAGHQAGWIKIKANKDELCGSGQALFNSLNILLI